MTESRCLWCLTPNPPTRRRGAVRKFCSPACRNAFWSAARKWVAWAVDTGLLTADNLKRAPGAPQERVHGSENASERAA